MYIPKAALEVTAKDQNGKVVFTKTRIYEVYDLHFKHNAESGKTGYLGLPDFDITAQDHVNLGIEPNEVDSHTFVVPLEVGTKSVVVEAAFKYLYEDGEEAVIKSVTSTVDFTK